MRFGHKVIDNGQFLTLTNVDYHGDNCDISWSKRLASRGASQTLSTWIRDWPAKVPDGHAYAVTFAALSTAQNAQGLMDLFAEDFGDFTTEHIVIGEEYLLSATSAMLANTVVEPHAVGGIWSLLPETKRPHKIIHRPRSKQEVYDATLLGSRKFSYDGTIMFPEGYGLGKRICRKLLGPVDQRELARGVYRATSLQFLLDYEMSPGLPRMNDEIFLSNLGEGTYRPHFLALHQDNGKLRFWLRPNTSLSNSREYYGGRVRTFRIE